MGPEHAEALIEAHKTPGLAPVFTALYQAEARRFTLEAAQARHRLDGPDVRPIMEPEQMLMSARAKLQLAKEEDEKPATILKEMAIAARRDLISIAGDLDATLREIERDSGADSQTAAKALALVARADAMAAAFQTLADKAERYRVAAYDA